MTLEKAQAKNKTGSNRPRASLRIGGEEWLGRVSGAEVAYLADGGTSEVAFETEDTWALRFLQDAPVVAKIGYGDDLLAPWFEGRLSFTEEGDPVGWGPFKLMAEQKFLEPVSYKGFGLDAALLDIARRAGLPGGSVEVRGGGEFVLGKRARFSATTTLANAANSLLKSAGYVGPDRPGYRTVFMPLPRPGATEARAVYDGGTYPPGGFAPKPSRRGFYSKVLISARLPDGKPAFPPVVLPVENRGRYRPPANRVYAVTDFKGDSAEALRTGLALVRKLERGTVPFELSGIAANPDLSLYDAITCVAVEKADAGGRTPEHHEVRYECGIDASIAAQLSREGNTMALSGTCVEAARKVLPKPFYVSRRRSPVVGASP